VRVEYVSFTDRMARIEYVATRFRRFLAGKVLDVGCDRSNLKTLIPDIAYTGLDIAGDPDVKLNLETMDRLPFDDDSYECVVCTDVLEHLDNLHFVFGELVRVARNHLIVSLPNNWTNARLPIERGKGSFDKYGLPVEPPPDRHKWFFGLQEAVEFLRGQEKKYPFSILEMRVTEKPRPVMVRALRRVRYPSRERYWNRYAHTVWAVMEKDRAKDPDREGRNPSG
jgi:SAM-dependent methyltransferase